MVMTSKIARFLGSIRLAVPLLGMIVVILIGATFYESYVGSATVQKVIYKSPWFGALMFLLAVNLGISTLSRYPWRGPRKIGFALAHFGLIVIIAGSAAVIHLSTEGMLLVRTDSGPNSQIRVEGDLLELVTPAQIHQQTDIFVRQDGTVYPSTFGELSLMGYTENAIKTVNFVDGAAVDNLAVKLRLHSDRMGQTLERWVAVAPAAYSQLSIGPAQLEVYQAANKQELQTLLSPPDAETGRFGQLQLVAAGDAIAVDIDQQLGQVVSLTNDTTVEVIKVWPDFRLDANNQPTSASEQFRNPAVQLNVTQGNLQERWFVFSQPGFEPVRSGDAIALEAIYDAPTQTAPSFFRVVAAPDHRLFYAARSSQGWQSGELQPGEAIIPGWADFTITLAEQIDHAQVQRSIVPVTPVASGTLAQEGSPALHVATPDGQDHWLPWGEPTTLETADGTYFAAFSPKLLQLPFAVKLDDFIVERNEGSESVAMWTSLVTLISPHRGEAVQRRVWMNHPTWFDGWKLAQASWNPGDLQQSTLQLKREPWWVTALTWSGSLMVVLGIGTMFYGPGLVKQFKRWSKSVSPESESPDETQEATPTIPILAVFGK
jgi:hypothetical protein